MNNLSNIKISKEIVLFLKKGSRYDINYVVDEIHSRYPNLGKAKIISSTPQSGIPLFYFSGDPDMVISADNASVSIAMHEEYFDKLATIVFDIVDIFEECDIKFIRIGCVTNIFLSMEYIDIIKDKYLKSEELDDISEYSIGWYTKLKTKHYYLNCWEKFVTEKINNSLLCQYDINTPINKTFDFEMKSIKEFFKVSEKYIESRVKKI